MTVLLVRHTEVALCWRGRCYGASDAGLGRMGAAHARQLAADLADWRPTRVIHSGLRRATILADLIGVAATIDPRWRERDFGDWEGQTWTAIHRATGSAMDGMIDAPASFRPGGGETTIELADRVRAAFAALPPGRVIVVTHGGPIAALCGDGRPPRDWLALVPPPGGRVELGRTP